MNNRAFSAGVVPGGLTSDDEIKILLCYLLAKLPEPVAHAPLIGALTKEGLLNYFECADALSDLINAGNIAADGDSYTVTDTGRSVAGLLYRDLPLTVRERALLVVKDAVRLQKNQKQHHTELREVANGYMVRCSISEGEGEIFAVELYAPSRYYAQNIQRNFVLNGETIVKAVFDGLVEE